MSLRGAAPSSPAAAADVPASAQAEGLRWLRKVRWKIGIANVVAVKESIQYSFAHSDFWRAYKFSYLISSTDT